MTEENTTVEYTAAADEMAFDTLADAAEAAAVSDGAAEGDELSALRSEILELKAALSKKEAEKEKILGELEEFSRLFPDTPIKSVPENVWRNVDRGIPLSAAYALYERETARLFGRANEVNIRNAAMSAGKAGFDSAKEYFSPDEVRAMSQAEVHENYKKIQNSMKHWR